MTKSRCSCIARPASRFRQILQTQQLVYRALAVTGLWLIARAAGLNPVLSLTAAALVSLGATVNGPQVLTVEYEPVPRGFALSLAVFSIGLLVTDRLRWAALASTLAFAYHPPTAAPVFVIVAVLSGRRELPVLAIGPLLVAASAIDTASGIRAPCLSSAVLIRT